MRGARAPPERPDTAGLSPYCGSLTLLDRSRVAVVDVLHQRRQVGRAPARDVVPAGQCLVGAVGTDHVVVEISRVLRGVLADGVDERVREAGPAARGGL